MKCYYFKISESEFSSKLKISADKMDKLDCVEKYQNVSSYSGIYGIFLTAQIFPVII